MDSPSESGSTTSDTNTPVMQHQHGAKAPHNNNNKNNNNNNSEHGVVHMIDDDFVDRIHFPKDPDEDDVGFKAMFEAATNLQTVNWVRGAWRTTVYVSFPLFTLAVHPNTMFTFGIASMLVAAVVSTSCHRNTLGEQIGLHTWTWRGMTYMMVLGTIFDYWNIYGHVASWWGMIAAGIFVAGLPTDTNIRKFMYLYFFVYIMEGRMYYSFLHMVPHHNAALFAADCYMGTMFGVAASLFPYPVLLKTTLDMMMTRLFGGIGKMLVAMRTHVWSNNPHASVLFFNDRSPFERIELLSGLLGTLLWFVNWEPLEFPLRNPIRRLKLSFLRRIMALTYAAFDAGRTISHLRRDQAERVAMLRVRRSMLAKVPGLKMDDSVLQRQVLDAESDYCSDALLLSVEKESGTEEMMRMKREIDALRANTYEYVVHFTNVLGDAVAKVGSTNSTPECLVETIPLNDLAEADTHMRRNLRLEMVQAIGRQCEMVKRHKSGGANNNNNSNKKEEEDDHAGEDGLTADDLTALLEFQAVVDDAEVYIRLHMLFFHTLLSMIAGEIAAFGDQMKTYAPEKSLCARLLDHFIYEPWHDFWSELWCLLNLARPSDYRTVKDAIKMTCAYLSACAFNFELWMPKDMFLYTFGTTILLGLPVEEESLNMGINRTAGNVIGCALGYLVYHNTHTLAQIIATTMCFVFMCQCAKNHPLYGQTFFYASVITMGGVATSIMDTDLIIRVMASSYTVLSYMLCCMLIFPNNPIKIVFNYRLKLAKVMSELLDDVAITARLEVKYGMGKDISPMDPDGEDHLLTAESELDQMCSQLNVQLSLADKMLIMCDKWTPFAARDPVVRGMLPFPDGPSRYIHGAQQRIVASLQLLVFGMQLLHRPRFERPNPQVRSIMSGSLADFLEDFADISRAVFQDFINSIHLSRTWSYDHSLTLVSRLSRMRVHMYASLYQCYVLLGSPLVDSAPKLSTADVDRLITDVAAHRGGAGPAHPQQHPPASQQPRHSNPLLSGGDEDDTLMPEGSFADRVLQTRHDTNSIHPTPVNLHDSVAVSSTNNMRYLHQAKLRESAAPPKGSYPFGAESPELELAGDIKRDRREDEAELQRRQSHMHVEDGGHRTEFEPDAEPSRRNTQDGGAVSAGGGVLPRYRGPNFSYQEDAMDLPVDTDLVALISIFSSCGAIMSELENMTGPVKNCSDFQKQLHEESLAIKLIDRVSDKITSYRRGIYERYHFLDAPTDSKLYSQVDPFMQWRF